ncbi:DUF2273 domain-containing protein [bacterium]|nr:DUF2273 domain-containing protein [bacterium]
MERIKKELLEISNRYPGPIIGSLVGLLIGLLAVLIIKFLGFWAGVLVSACIGAGFYIGMKKGAGER